MSASVPKSLIPHEMMDEAVAMAKHVHANSLEFETSTYRERIKPRILNQPRSVAKQSQGLGDTVAWLTRTTRIDRLIKRIFTNCGCDKRRRWLNRIIPYRTK